MMAWTTGAAVDEKKWGGWGVSDLKRWKLQELVIDCLWGRVILGE